MESSNEFFKPPETIGVFMCTCGAPPTLDDGRTRTSPPKCSSHPYPARALGPPMERFTYTLKT